MQDKYNCVPICACLKIKYQRHLDSSLGGMDYYSILHSHISNLRYDIMIEWNIF